MKKIIEWRWWFAAVVIAILLISAGFVRDWPDITGFDGKTIWDLLELLIIPAVLAVGGFLLNRAQRRSELEIATAEREAERLIAKDREEERAVQNYLEAMTRLLLEEDLRNSEEDSEVRSIARSRTLTVLRSLNGERKGSIVRFLYEANLISRQEPIIKLSEADLTEADLSFAKLNGADLSFARLKGADLSGVDLSDANLSMANLFEGDLLGANLRRANLRRVQLREANLRFTILHEADLSRATLLGAKYNNDTTWPAGFDPEQEGAILIE